MPRLRHVDCSGPGLARRRHGRGFVYLDEHGRTLKDREVLDRVKRLAIPPAWEDVWICPVPNGHLQAVGTDAAGRRQYLYHPLWRERRDRRKFDDVLAFAEKLPAVRRKISRLLSGEELTRDRVLACAIGLLDEGLFRVGGDEYADENGSHGLATLERRHVEPRPHGVVWFEYEGKSGQHQAQEIRDRKLARVVEQLMRSRRRSPRLLAYRDGRRWSDVSSGDVNAFLKELVGDEFSAKDFRTWHATVLAAVELAETEDAHSPTARKRAVAAAVRKVAASLGNTPAVCRASYIDPRIIDRFQGGQTIAAGLGQPAGASVSRSRLNAIESAVLALLS